MNHNQTGQSTTEQECGRRHRVGDGSGRHRIDVAQQEGRAVVGNAGHLTGIVTGSAQLIGIADARPVVDAAQGIGSGVFGNGGEADVGASNKGAVIKQ